MVKKIKKPKALTKKYPTGKDVGEAYLYSYIHEIANEGKPHAPLFPQDQLERMVVKVGFYNDELQFYSNLKDTIHLTRNNAISYENDLKSHLNQYVSNFHLLAVAEEDYTNLESRPLIMTDKEYTALHDKTLKHLRSIQTDYYSVLFNSVFHYLGRYLDNDKTLPSYLKVAFDKLAKEPIEDKAIQEKYKRGLFSGFYQLPEGIKLGRKDLSAFLSGYRHAMETSKGFQTLKRLFFEGIEFIRDYFEKTGNMELLKQAQNEEGFMTYLEGYLKHSPAIETNKRLLYLLDTFINDGVPLAQWQEAEVTPTKLDLLKASYNFKVPNHGPEDVLTYFYCFDRKKTFKAFTTQYKDLYERITGELRRLINKTSKTNYDRLLNGGKTTYGELADNNLPNYEKLIVPNYENFYLAYDVKDLKTFINRNRIKKAGIAIIKPETLGTGWSDKYQDPAHVGFLSTIRGIDNIKPHDFEAFRYQRENVILNFKKIHAYNALIDIFADLYINDIQVASHNLDKLFGRIDAVNGVLYDYYLTVYGDPETKEEKRKKIRANFKTFNVRDLKPNEDHLKQLRTNLKKGGVDNPNLLIPSRLEYVLYQLTEGVH